MLTLHLIILGLAVGALARRPRSWRSAVFVSLAGALAATSHVLQAAAAVAPLLAFLTAALGAALLAGRMGLVEAAARLLLCAAHGRALALYWLTCGLAALLTALVSLDGAILLMVPVVLVLARTSAAPLRALLGGTIAVVNAFSAALPEGNPTNLVLMERLGISPLDFLRWMTAPACAATLVCAVLVAVRERHALASPLEPFETNDAAPPGPRMGLMPLRIALQVGGLLALVLAVRTPLGLDRLTYGGRLPDVLAVSLAVAATASAANNLPISTIVAGLLAPGPAAFAAMSGLAAGSLATPHGSVATLIAHDLARPRGARDLRFWVPTAAAGTAIAATVLWLVGA